MKIVQVSKPLPWYIEVRLAPLGLDELVVDSNGRSDINRALCLGLLPEVFAQEKFEFPVFRREDWRLTVEFSARIQPGLPLLEGQIQPHAPPPYEVGWEHVQVLPANADEWLPRGLRPTPSGDTVEDVFFHPTHGEIAFRQPTKAEEREAIRREVEAKYRGSGHSW